MLGKLDYITRLIAAAVLPALLVGCSDEFRESDDSDGDVATVTFRTCLDAGLETRAISDGTNVDKLLVAVYESDGTGHTEALRTGCDLSEAIANGVELRLLSGRSYSVLFWAYDNSNTAYTVSDQGTITADYSNYLNGGFAGMEELDAFYAVSTVSVSENSQNASVTLTRPFAQVNFADDSTTPLQGTHVSEVTFDKVATSFDPFTGKSVGAEVEKTFSFNDFPSETLESGGDTYYYVATNYLFVPQSSTVSASLKLTQNGMEITKRDIPSIALAANKRTNVLGTIVQQPEDIWDGIALTAPDQDSQNRYVIDETSDIAWLSSNGNSLEKNSTFIVTKNLNMGDKTIKSVTLPEGSRIEGEGHTVRNVTVSGGGLFGNVTDFAISNLTVDNIATTGVTGHVGALVNTLKGNCSFTSVTVKGATVATSDGAAGGFVGYVVRKSEKDRNETLSVSFSGCKIENSSVSGVSGSLKNGSEGVFVGLLSGYDLGEKLSFDTDCSASGVTVTDFNSPYKEGNEGKWLADNDYSKYNGWLGDEVYNRGTVMYGANRFIPCWDGTKKVTPLTDTDGTKLIYSAFDLAALQGGGHSAVTFKEDVDLGGDGANKNLFTPISSISKLDGENHSLYNLNIYRESWVNGFVTGTSGDTEHKNLHFVNSSVRAKMDGTELRVYVGTLCPYVEHKYTVNNVTITNGYVLGLNKLGGLIGFVTSWCTGALTVQNCKIESSKIENIQSSAEDDFMGVTFNPQGEAGGLVGFIHNNSAQISDCSVSNSEIKCYGQDNKWLVVTIPGRHVNDFIGDIRLDDTAYRVDLNNNSVKNNTFTQRKKDTDSNKCTIVGKCYTINIKSLNTKKGKVYINNTKVFG